PSLARMPAFAGRKIKQRIGMPRSPGEVAIEVVGSPSWGRGALRGWGQAIHEALFNSNDRSVPFPGELWYSWGHSRNVRYAFCAGTPGSRRYVPFWGGTAGWDGEALAAMVLEQIESAARGPVL